MSYHCTEITIDTETAVGATVRLWIGTKELLSHNEYVLIASDAIGLMRRCIAGESRDVVEYARRNIPFLNAVQVKVLANDQGDWVGVMGYTQPFEDNDRERFGPRFNAQHVLTRIAQHGPCACGERNTLVVEECDETTISVRCKKCGRHFELVTFP